MKDPNDIDFTTLNWVKQELDETIKQARQALEAYVEDQGDKSQLKYCANYLHQVQGTLRMVELYGAAMVVEEMEKVSLALVDGEIKTNDDILEVLMRGLVQMPDYLGRLQGGHRDIPIVLLPLLNDLRACRSEKLLSETSLFAPNLAAVLPVSAAGASSQTPDAILRANASKLRLAYQFGLLKWIKGDDVDGNLGRLIAILDRLRSMSVQADARRLWWIGSAVLEGVVLKALDASVAVKLLYGKVDREIKRVVDQGEASFASQPPTDLTKSLLYYAAHAESKGARLAELKNLYKLDTLLPSESELEHAKSALSGRNKALLDTVGAAIKEDVMRVKDGLDMFLRGTQENPGELAPQGETLQRVADTLGVLGLGIPRKVVIEQRDIVTSIVTGKIQPEEQTLLDVAGALLYVESSLDDYIQRLGQGQETSESSSALKGLELPQAEVRRILDATMKEASVNLSQAKQDIVAFIESPWDHGKIEGIPKLLEEISGALRMLNMPEPAALNDGITRFVEVELVRHKRVPTSEQLDLMADALASIEYYLEAIREARPNRERILEVTRRSLESLGYWPLPDPNGLGTGASLDDAPSSTDFVSFPDDFQSQRIDSLTMAPKAPSFTIDQGPTLTLADIPMTASDARAMAPESLELDLSGMVLSETESTTSTSQREAEPDAFTDFDLSMLEEAEPSVAFDPDKAVVPQEAVFDFNFDADPAPALKPYEPAQPQANSPIEDLLDLDAIIGEDPIAEVTPDFDFSEPFPEAPIGDSAFSSESIDFTVVESQASETPAFEENAFDLASLDELKAESILDEPIAMPAPAVSLKPEAKPLPKTDTGFASGFQMVPSDDIDDEIREVFVEEVQDELIGLAKSYPGWKADQNDFEKLKPVRRSFHTLKGSGRLVGALAIGEFSWKIENMLNRVLDKSIPVSPAVLACLDESIAALPQLLAGLKGESIPTANIGGIMYVADRVSAGEEIFLPKNEPASVVEASNSEAQPAAGAVNLDEASDELVAEEIVDLPEVFAPEAAEIAVAQAQDFSPKQEHQAEISDLDELFAGVEGLDSSDLAALASLGIELDPAAGSAEEPVQMAQSTSEADLNLHVGEEAIDDLSVDRQINVPIKGGLPEALANDPVLVEILKSEAGTHVNTIRKYITFVDGSDEHHPVSDELLRAVHTLNGAVAMVDLPAVTNVIAPLEGYLKRLKGKKELIGEAGLEALNDAADLIDSMVLAIDRGDVRQLDSSALSSRVLAMRDELPIPTAVTALYDEEELGDLAPIDESEVAQSVIDGDESQVAQGAVDQYESQSLGEPDAFAITDLSDLADLEAFSPQVAGQMSEASLAVDDAPSVDPELLRRADALVADLARLEEQAFAPIQSKPEVLVEDFDLGLTPETALDASIAGEQEDGFADLAFLEADFDLAPVDSNETERELLDLDELVAGEIAAMNLAEENSEQAFADLGFFEEFAVQTDVENNLELNVLPRQDKPPAATEESQAARSAIDKHESQVAQGAVNQYETTNEVSLFSADSELDQLLFSDFASNESAFIAEHPESDNVLPFEAHRHDSLTPTEPESQVAQGAVDQYEPRAEQNNAQNAQVDEIAEASAFAMPGLRITPIANDPDPDGPLELADPDEELLEIFVEEGGDILDSSDNLMVKLKETPEDREIVANLQRELHTLKGGARMAGVNAVGDLSHSMESLFEAIVDKRANNSPVAMEALEKSFDRLHQMITRVGKRQAVGIPDNLVARLDALVDGREDEFMSTETVLASEPVEAQVSAQVPLAEVQKVEAPKSSTPTKSEAPRAEKRTALDEDENASRQQQESIRVRADLIDNLVNYAGEVSIYRSRLEAQIGGFRFNLQEFDQTVSRLREQLRKLEMETEAQILSRYQREDSKRDAGFDPLELDQFSNLQQLSRALAESVSDLVSLQGLMDDIARQSETLLLQQSRVSSELQEGLMRTRMVPFDSLVPRLRRIIRQTGGELGKRASLKVEGASGEMDRTVMERMTAPLEHMLRNALAHGLETPAGRREAGKAEEGNVTISVSREATEVLIKVTDDGKGMDRDAIRRKAIERGMLRPDTQLSDRDLFQFVLETGFSTAESVSKIAGRGVGMDVVNSEIKQLGGSLLIDSVKGVGSVFTVRLPFTLSVTQAILIKLADTTFAVPLSSVQGVMRMPRRELDRRIAENDLEVSYAGETYQIYDLGDLIRQPIAYAKDETQVPLVMTRSGDQRAAVRVSQVVGSKEVVVKAVGAQLSSVPGFFGATIMGDGSVIVILDLAPLVRHGAALRQAPELASELDLDVVVTAPVEARQQKLVMVVDDSITMRKVTTRVLERNDMEVVTAKDGLDAVEQLQDRIPDLMLLDIEMPRMDGYELATYMKNDARLKHIPIIMITSRTGDKHRQRAMEIGVERYLGKPYQEVDLLKNVMESLNGVSAK
jgi:chemosensory pili system protein ChpA (sensor histidine kinase/response regulator)